MRLKQKKKNFEPPPKTMKLKEPYNEIRIHYPILYQYLCEVVREFNHEMTNKQLQIELLKKKLSDKRDIP